MSNPRQPAEQPPPPRKEPMSIDAPPKTITTTNDSTTNDGADQSNSKFQSRGEVLRRRSVSNPPQPPPPPSKDSIMSFDTPPNTTTDDSTKNDGANQSNSKFQSREEVLRRRSERVKKLAKMYRSNYWTLMEELKSKYRYYYWTYGKSPYKDDNGNGGDGGEKKEDDGVKKCGVAGCKMKAMALTSFCHPHILSDSKQTLYTACNYVIKNGHSGPIFCGKPILKTIVPSLCSNHFQKAEKHVARALRKAGPGLNITSPCKFAPKLHVVVAEYVRQIQSNRRAASASAAQKVASVNVVEIKEEKMTG